MADPHILAAPERERRTALAAGRRNMLLLTHLRWIAALGQLVTILLVAVGLGVHLPLVPMIGIVAGLVLLNIATLVVLRRGEPVANWELFAALVVDFGALTVQLYLSGGATNPFAPIGLLQVVLGAVLLETWSGWALVALHGTAFGLLALLHRPLPLPPGYASSFSPTQIFASWLNFVMVAVLLMLFVTRISRNLRSRDEHLAELRQRAVEEDHIVRMGLLASGAAHELGTPLSSLSVILGDWRRTPAFAEDPAIAEEMDDAQAAVARCKQIVTGILYASGEARSESPERTTLRRFLRTIVEQWPAPREDMLHFVDRLEGDPPIVADRTLSQIINNMLDNAVEAGASRIAIVAELTGGELHISLRDDGSGFATEILETIGKPYRSTKPRQGAGLGLFLAVNVLRQLGGSLDVHNGLAGGAVVTLTIPLESLALEDAA